MAQYDELPVYKAGALTRQCSGLGTATPLIAEPLEKP